MVGAARRGIPSVWVLLFLPSLLFSLAAASVDFSHCGGCDDPDDALWTTENILQCQKVSDFLIAAAYFSIPLELLYFATCSDLFPLKWIVLQFGAFIVLCGLTHLIHPLVSFATAITLLTLIPQLLRVKVRENFLMNKARELDREVGMMKRKEEASWHVRMLTHEIRKTAQSRFMKPDVLAIKATKDAIILGPESALGIASRSKLEAGPVAAIRMPMLSVSNFKGGTPEVMDTSYAILVLTLPNDGSLGWGRRELEIVEVVADQVAVALSHAAVLEESQLMREKLA
ncbi:hypothetical protein HU200_010555 [Digitaria exilis]|uniref:histidine kinase n=1 Tax=Digitaria exilis TaxID=1010633 RepID=A0A835KNG8_9POAL|nr:hypothetical protein HU200_010555 [Digitaria exilis]